LIVTGKFVKDDAVIDGVIVVMSGGNILWAGPAQQCPLDSVLFQERQDAEVHMHPSLYARIEAAVRKVTKGIEYVPGAV
jgi:hypothetical protein